MSQQYPVKPPGVETAHTLNTIAWVLSLIGVVVGFIAGGIYAYLASAIGSGLLGALAFYLFVVAIIDIIIVVKVRRVNGMLDSGMYEEARRSLLPWVVVGFIFGGIIVGILLLVAYIKVGDAVEWQRLYSQ